MSVGDSAGIDYVTGIERNLDEEVQDSAMALAVAKVEDASMKSNTKEDIEEPLEDVEEEDMEVPSQGLMARRV